MIAWRNAQLNLNKAYTHFFRDKSVGFPRFKSKKNTHQSYTTNNQKETAYIKNGCIKLPTLKTLIRIKQHRQFLGLIKSVTISQTPTGKYFVSVLVEEKERLFPKMDTKVGIDIGLKDFAI